MPRVVRCSSGVGALESVELQLALLSESVQRLTRRDDARLAGMARFRVLAETDRGLSQISLPHEEMRGCPSLLLRYSQYEPSDPRRMTRDRQRRNCLDALRPMLSLLEARDMPGDERMIPRLREAIRILESLQFPSRYYRKPDEPGCPALKKTKQAA